MRLSDRVLLTLSGDLGCSLSDAKDCNAYAVLCGGEVVLVDAGVGLGTEALLRNLESDGVSREQVRTLLLTHGHLDHAGGAQFLRAELDLKVYASEKTAAALRTGDEEMISLARAKQAGIYGDEARFEPCAVDQVLRDGDAWSVGDVRFRAMATPGHSDDSFSFLAQTPTELLAFVGDAVFHGGKILLQDAWDCRPSAYGESLRALAALPVDGLFPGHGVWSLKRGAAQIGQSLPYLDRLLLPQNLL